MTTKTFDIEITGWHHIPASLYKFVLQNSNDINLRFRLFLKILRYHGIPVRQMSIQRIQSLFTIIDWEFLEYPPKTALIPQWRSWRGKKYKMPKEKLSDFTCLEFQLLEKYYNEYTKNSKNSTALHNLVYIVLNIGKVKTQEQVERHKNIALPLWMYRNILTYCHANLTWFAIFYKKALGSGSGKGDGIGWTSTFMTVAENHLFGGFESVYQTNIHTVMTYLVKKTKEQQEIQNRSTGGQSIGNF